MDTPISPELNADRTLALRPVAVLLLEIAGLCVQTRKLRGEVTDLQARLALLERAHAD
jgi:hypothetical protein